MLRILSSAVLTAGILFGAASIASAAEPVERSGNVFHVAVCSRLVPARTARCNAHVVTDSAGHALAQTVTPDSTPNGFGPSQLDSAYNITTGGSASTTIAIVDAYGYPNAEADLAVYRSQFGLPACTTANGCFAKYNQKGKAKKYPAFNLGWAQETALDLDMASAMCPNCKIILVEGTSATFGNLAAAVDTAASKGAHVISNSYGGGESGSSTYEPSYNHPGVAITASSGDSGYGAQFPATSGHVIAVGGTHLVKAAAAAASCTPSRPGRPTPAARCAWRPTPPPSPIPRPASRFARPPARPTQPGWFSAAPASPRPSSAASSATMAGP
jgi:hypothetical protein